MTTHFYRARRELLINLSHVKHIKAYDRSTFMLIMADADQTELLVSERQAKELRESPFDRMLFARTFLPFVKRL